MFVYFWSGSWINWAHIPALPRSRHFSYYLRRGRCWIRRLLRFLSAETFCNALTFFIYTRSSRYGPFISVSPPLPTTDFCLLTIWSNISVSMTDLLLPHSHDRTKKSSQMGSLNLGTVLCQSSTARTAGGNVWLELRKGVPLYSSKEALLLPRDTLPVHSEWPLYFSVSYR